MVLSSSGGKESVDEEEIALDASRKELIDNVSMDEMDVAAIAS